MKIKKIEFIKCNNMIGVNVNGFEIWADGVIYNTLNNSDIPAYIFNIRDKITKNNKIILKEGE